MAFTAQAQKNSFDASLTASQQFIKEDSGIAFEGVLGYYFSNAFKMEINFGSARLDSKELNRKTISCIWEYTATTVSSNLKKVGWKAFLGFHI